MSYVYVSTTIKNAVLNYNEEQIIVSGGTAYNTTINKGGYESVSNGYAISTTINSGGSQTCHDNGYTYQTVIGRGGVQTLYGEAVMTHVKSGGTQIVIGGISYNTVVSRGGVQSISYGGIAYDTVVNSGAEQYIHSGSAYDTIVKKGGTQVVTNGEAGIRTIIKKGGEMTVSSGGSALSPVISSGGKLFVDGSSYIGNIDAMKGAVVSMGGTYATLYRSGNKFVSATVSARVNTVLRVQSGSDLTLGGNVKMKNITLNIGHAQLKIAGIGNTVQGLQGKYEKISYDLSTLSSANKKAMISLVDKTETNYKKAFVNVNSNQALGTYKLAKNISNPKAIVSIDSDSSHLGYASVNGSGLNINGVTYKVSYNSKTAETKISLKAYGDKIYIGAKDAKLQAGTNNSDIFFGSSENDTITGKNGRDVAIYDKSEWGKDVISKTSGTMTLLFKDIASSDITKKISGSDLIINKKSSPNEQITIKGYSADTHNLIFTNSSLNNFSSYVATPSTDLIKAVKNEIWKAAKLA